MSKSQQTKKYSKEKGYNDYWDNMFQPPKEYSIFQRECYKEGYIIAREEDIAVREANLQSTKYEEENKRLIAAQGRTDLEGLQESVEALVEFVIMLQNRIEGLER
jgi:hypothetical protein